MTSVYKTVDDVRNPLVIMFLVTNMTGDMRIILTFWSVIDQSNK